MVDIHVQVAYTGNEVVQIGPQNGQGHQFEKPAGNEPYADAKSALQEWAQGQGLALPSYTEVSREGPDHAPLFTTEVRVDAKRFARGTGASKRIAEQAAAARLLNTAGVWKVEP